MGARGGGGGGGGACQQVGTTCKCVQMAICNVVLCSRSCFEQLGSLTSLRYDAKHARLNIDVTTGQQKSPFCHSQPLKLRPR